MHPQDTTGPAPEAEAEEWRPVVGYEGWYSVSSLGRVRREAASSGARPGRVRQPKPNKRGYLTVSLSKHNRVRTPFVHTLVAEAFIGARPSPKHGINHRNGIRSDNRACNLEWATTAENMAHAVATGLMQHGERSPARKYPQLYAAILARRTPERTARGEHNGSAVLTEEAVKDILRSPLSGAALAKKYGVGDSTISRIRRRTHWRHISAE